MQNKRLFLIVVLEHKGNEIAENIAVITVFTGTDNDTVIITAPHQCFKIVNHFSAMILPRLPTPITPGIFCSPIMDAKKARRAAFFKMLCRRAQHQPQTTNTHKLYRHKIHLNLLV